MKGLGTTVPASQLNWVRANAADARE